MKIEIEVPREDYTEDDIDNVVYNTGIFCREQFQNSKISIDGILKKEVLW